MSSAPVKIVIEVLRKVTGDALPIRIRHILGDIFKSRGKIHGAIRRRALRFFLALLKQLYAFADNFISRMVASAANLLGNQALNVRA